MIKPYVLVGLLLLSAVALTSVMGVGRAGYSPASYYGPPITGSTVKPLPPQTTVWLSFYLPPRNASMLPYIAGQVVSKHIQPLSHQQLIASYLPSQETFQALVGFLQSSGFTIAYESPDRFSVSAYADASTVDSVFHTTLYLYSYQNTTYYAPATTSQIPQQLAGIQISGLTNRTAIQTQYLILGKLEDGRIVASSLPHSTPDVGLSTAATYYAPSVLDGAYGASTLISQGYGGRGQSVAIIDAYGDPLIQQDLGAYDKQFGLPPANLTIVPVGPYHPELGVGTGWDVETALDVEAVHSMAPYAHIYLVVASNPQTLYEAVDYVVSADLANVTSMSWGGPESLFGQSGFYYSGFFNYPYADYYFALGAAEGISFFAASGDQGAYSGTPTTQGGVLFPASSPFVTAVGGTTLYVNVTSGSIARENANVTYGYEEAWSVSPDYSGQTVSSGGGYSTLFPTPWYQQAVDHSNYRAVPDVAADANPYTGFVVRVEGQNMVIGGTSLATPLWAGMTAILDQYLNRPLGLLNQYLYQIYGQPALYAEAFHQVYFGYNGAYIATGGYNLVTGLGTPNLPGLARALESLPPQLEVSVTLGGSGTTYPQFDYGSTVTVAATASYPNDSLVSSGSFEAYVYNQAGQYLSVPLSYNGSSWVGSFTVGEGAPPNTWSVVVEGQSSGYTGSGAADMEVGLSVTIIEPVPYPYGPPIAPNQPFTVAAAVTYPNGAPAVNASVVAEFQKNGVTLFNVTLLPYSFEQGVYVGQYALLSNMPQGVYTMTVYANISGQQGEAYTYEYFGEALLSATILTPSLDALPSASPGQTVTLYAESVSATGFGLFTSNVSAEFYYPGGGLAAKVVLQPAPDTVQYGLINLFGAQEANFTIPSSFTPGFYTVVFNSTYQGSSGREYGVYTTSLYVSSSTLRYSVHTLSQALEGQTVSVTAKIAYPNGTAVTEGVFMATAIPVSYGYVAYTLQLDTGVPMQYERSEGVWVANITLPSAISGGFYEGLPPSYLSGPWAVELTGEAPGGVQAQAGQTYLDVLPYTYVSYHLITPSNISSATLLTNGSGTPLLAGVGVSNLTLSGVDITLSGDYVVGLTITNGSNVQVVGSTLSGVRLVDSQATFTGDTVTGGGVGVSLTGSELSAYSTTFRNLTYAFSPENSTVVTSADSYVGVEHVSTLPQPSFTLVSPSTITGSVSHISVDVSGSQLKVTGASINGAPTNFSVTQTSTGLEVSLPFSSASEPDGVYVVTLNVSSGLGYTHSFSVVNLYHESTAQLEFGVVGIVALILGVVAVVLLALSRRSVGGGKT